MSESILQILPIVGMFIVAYFFFIRPQAQKKKLQDKFTKEVQKGDLIVTTSGIYARIIAVNEKNIEIDIAKGTIITIDKSAISRELSEVRNTKEKS